MAARVEAEKNKSYRCLVIDEKSKEMMHYAENADINLSNLTNFGIYLFSVRIFADYGLNPYPEEGKS